MATTTSPASLLNLKSSVALVPETENGRRRQVAKTFLQSLETGEMHDFGFFSHANFSRRVEYVFIRCVSVYRHMALCTSTPYLLFDNTVWKPRRNLSNTTRNSSNNICCCADHQWLPCDLGVGGSSQANRGASLCQKSGRTSSNYLRNQSLTALAGKHLTRVPASQNSSQGTSFLHVDITKSRFALSSWWLLRGRRESSRLSGPGFIKSD